MKSQGTYVLLALFFAALLSLWWADFARIPTREEIRRMSSRILPELIDAKPDDLQKIEILGGPEPLVFVRNDDKSGWQMTSPLNVEADPSKVETLAYNLKELSRKPEAAPISGDPAQFGLATPERVIRLWGDQSVKPLASLDIGLESDPLGRRYVRATGTKNIEVIDSRSLALLKIATIAWRDHELFRVPSFEVDVVSVQDQSRELKLRRGRDFWRIEVPLKLIAAEAKVEGLIADLGSLRISGDDRFIANDVRPLDLERYGLRKPELTIQVEAGRASRRRPPQVLHVGKPVEGKPGLVYVLRGGQNDVLAVDSRVLKDLRPNPNAFRSSKVADLKLARVNRIAVEQPSGGFELVRTGQDWKISHPEDLPADRKSVEEFLKALDKLETSTYPQPGSMADFGLNPSSPVLKIWQVADRRDTQSTSATPDPNGDLALSLRIGRRDSARRATFVQIEGDPTVLALPEAAGDVFPRSVLAFRDRRILHEEIDPIQRITLKGGERSFVLNSPPFKIDPIRFAPMGWWMVEPVDAPADAPSVGALLGVLAGLQADALVTETAENLESYGLKPPALSVTWARLPHSSKDADSLTPIAPAGVIPLQNRTLLVGSIVPGRPTQRFAKLDDRPLIFTVGTEVLKILDSEWRDHRAISLQPAQVRKIRFEWPSRSLTAESSGGNRPNWSLTPATDAPDFDPNTIYTLLKTVSNLTTSRYYQHHGEFPSISGLKTPRLTLRFELDDGTSPRTLRLGATDPEGNLFATIENEPSGAVFLVAESSFKTWLKPPRAGDDLPDNVFAP